MSFYTIREIYRKYNDFMVAYNKIRLERKNECAASPLHCLAPRAETLVLVNQVKAVLVEYAE